MDLRVVVFTAGRPGHVGNPARLAVEVALRVVLIEEPAPPGAASAHCD